MAALEQSLDVPAIVARLTGPNPARDQVVARVKELMDKELLALADDIATHPEIGFEEKRSVSKLTEYLQPARLQRRDRQRRPANRVRREISAEQRRAAPRDHRRIRRAARDQGRVSRRSAQRAGAGRAWRRRLRWPSTSTRTEDAGQRHRLRHAGRRDDAAQREDGDARGARVRRRRRHRAQPRVSATTRPARWLRHVLPEHRRREVHVQRRAHASDDAVERPQRARGGDSSVRQHRRRPRQHPARGAHPGDHLEGGTAPNVMPDRTVADFYIRYPDEVYLQQVVEFVDNAAKAAALATGTKVKIDHYGKDLDGIGVATLGEVGIRVHEEVRRDQRHPEARQAAGIRGDRQRVARHPRHRHHRAVVDGVEPHLRDGRGQPQGDRPQGFHDRRAGDGGGAVRLRHARRTTARR